MNSAFLKRHDNRFILAAGTILAVLLRYSLFPYESLDYKGFLRGWYDFIAEHGFSAFGQNFSNYNPPYLYLLAIMIYVFPFLSKIVAIKLISVVFDLILAWFIYKLISLKYPGSMIAVCGCFAVLFAPTVFLNSACWGQADSIYTAGLAACLYWILTNKQWRAMAAFGFAIAVKAQAIFFAPLLLVLLLKRRISWKPIILIPTIYILALLPAWFAGRNLSELLLTYVSQSSNYHELSKNAPTLFEWFPDSAYSVLYPAGLILAATIVLILIAAYLKSSQNMQNDLIIQSAFVFVLIVPYFLPKMHERYFYPADIFSIAYAFYFPKYFFIPIVVIFCSFLAYLPYLFKVPIPISILSVVLGIVVVIVAHQLTLILRNEGNLRI
jgi:Gpi18-like mannosyltransferase